MTSGIETKLDRATILVVDDQPALIRSLHALFKERYRVLVATGGAAALEICSRQRPDLVLLDINMPEMDGLQVCRTLKQDPHLSHIPIIFVTSKNRPEDETVALEAGAVDFVSKPINPSVVQARVRTHLTLKAQSDHLRELALLDGLTGIYNRRAFDDALEREWRSSRRHGSPLGLLVLDLDHFKRLNDHLGHQEGDVALRRVARALREGLHRPRDLVARYGGEEFACILPGETLSGARHVGERLRRQVETERIPHGDSPTAPWVTVSVGAASLHPTEVDDAQALIRQADANLYEAKRLGRNRLGPGDPTPVDDTGTEG